MWAEFFSNKTRSKDVNRSPHSYRTWTRANFKISDFQSNFVRLLFLSAFWSCFALPVFPVSIFFKFGLFYNKAHTQILDRTISIDLLFLFLKLFLFFSLNLSRSLLFYNFRLHFNFEKKEK